MPVKNLAQYVVSGERTEEIGSSRVTHPQAAGSFAGSLSSAEQQKSHLGRWYVGNGADVGHLVLCGALWWAERGLHSKLGAEVGCGADTEFGGECSFGCEGLNFREMPHEHRHFYQPDSSLGS